MESLRQQLTTRLQKIADEFVRVDLDHPNSIPVSLVPAKHQSHGDLTTPFALGLAKLAKQAPRVLAGRLAEKIGNLDGLIERVEIAGPGHLNFFVTREAWLKNLEKILLAGPKAIESQRGQNKRVLVEFVSANPTGPLHVAHGRGAVTGDVVSNLLQAAGFAVEREYYINDLGHQTDVLAKSVFYHYSRMAGAAIEQPGEFYPGDYVDDVARLVHDAFGNQFVGEPEHVWLDELRQFSTDALLRRIQSDLLAFGIRFDHWVSERSLCTESTLKHIAHRLAEAGHTYIEDKKTWFRSTAFGDDKDRVILREDGRPTYFLGDIAYHQNKMERGFDQLINVFGADHGGYVARVRAGIAALGFDPGRLDVVLIQMVSLSRGGEAVRMGKRLGTAVWLKDVIDEAGRDATRYMFLTRRADAQMDFDVDLAQQKSLDNPVFYAQMGHARLASIAKRAQAENIPSPDVSLSNLQGLRLSDEMDLIKLLDRVPDVVADAAVAQEPHQLIYYIQELISAFHSYYSRNKSEAKVISDDPATTSARLLLCRALQQVLAALLGLASVDAPDEMYLDSEPRADAASDPVGV